MNVGRMRFRVQVVRDVFTSDDLGQEVPTPTTVGTYWADISTLSGRELTNARQRVATVSHKVTMRWQGAGAVNSNDHLVYQGRTFHVDWINNADERNRQLDVYCTEVVS